MAVAVPALAWVDDSPLAAPANSVGTADLATRGMMNGVGNPHASIKAVDFAGGTVVHMSSGWSALVLCLILGKRQGFGHRSFIPT